MYRRTISALLSSGLLLGCPTEKTSSSPGLSSSTGDETSGTGTLLPTSSPDDTAESSTSEGFLDPVPCRQAQGLVCGDADAQLGAGVDLRAVAGCEVWLGSVFLPRNATDEELASFSSLRSAESLFNVGSNEFGDLRGLECLEYISLLSAQLNPNLVSLDGLEGVTRIGALSLLSTGALRDIRGLRSLEELDGLAVQGTELLESLEGLEGLTKLVGVTIGSNATLVDLGGLDNVSIISNDAVIASNTALTSLHGLETLQEIGRDLELRDNPVLEDLSALESLEHVGGDLTITGNLMLSPAEVDALLEGIEVGGTVTRD
ncbi:MAG: hypothetical protein ACRBN8_36955 [Nannocystales bacterium]